MKKEFGTKKEFNTTGTCYPELHYMMNNSRKMEQIMDLINHGKYFIINRPRQYGKTTTLHYIAEQLKDSEVYFPIALNFQGIDSKWHQSDEAFAQMFVNQLVSFFKYNNPDTMTFLKKLATNVKNMDSLSDVITEFTHYIEKKLILLIDEVDASSNYTPFLSFLGMLRTKYLARIQPHHATFYSIVLAGVHDVKSLKYKLRNPDDAKTDSPWNIAVDFEVDMSFNPQEIAPMLEEYCSVENVAMNIPAIAERLYYHTSGYPFLVSKLCQNIAKKIMPNKEEKIWTVDDVEQSVQMLLKENNTNFESLIKNLENNKELYDLVYRVIIDGAVIPFNPDEPITSLGRTYGVFKENGRLKIHNRIYEQRLYNYMAAKTEIAVGKKYNYGGHFTTENNSLDMEAALLKFQEFMRAEHSEKDKSFLERNGRLVFLSFLSPILNGQGYTFKEVETSEEKRLDIVVTYFQHRYIIELKRWYGEKYHQRGLEQLCNYLDNYGIDEGYLVIFEHAKEKTWEQEWLEVQGKRIFAVWL